MNKLIANGKAYRTLAALVHGGRFPHALMIEGPGGCGKTTFAREAAQAKLCSAEPALRPCGQCHDCVKAEKNIHPDIMTYSGEGGSRSFHISTVRELRREAYVRPNEAEGKVLILRDIQDMSVQAQNALLKILEEPSANVSFLLTCTSRSAMLETILSRVLAITLELPTVEQCAAHLQALQPGTEAQLLRQAAQRTGGNVGRTLILLEEESVPDPAADILYNACIGDELAALAALSKYERDRTGFSALLVRMKEKLSEAMLRVPADERYARLVARAGRLRLLQILDIIEDTALGVTQNLGGSLLAASLCSRIRLALSD